MDGTEDRNWEPFGRPLFKDPAARDLSRVGVVDIGSNSVRLVVFDGAARSPAYFYNEKIMCGLGAGINQSGRLNPEGRDRALKALKRFQLLAKGMKLAPLTAVATAAVRDAEDGPEFREDVLRETGLHMHVIDGREEARLSGQGVLLGWPDADGLMCDIGGSSMELAVIKDGQVGKRVSSGLGPLKLEGVKGGKKAMRKHITAVLAELAEEMGTEHKRLYLVGGSWRAIARLDMYRRDYPLTVLHEYRMSPKALATTLKWVGKTDLDEVRSHTGTSSTRMALVPTAAEVLKRLIRTFHPKEIAVSSYGIREGLLYEQMPDRLRQRDPLIEACRFSEMKDARMPGFGKSLYAFIRPLVANEPSHRRRLVKAACLLHDVTWRAHPDYRHEVCFDNVTRANLGGLTHEERVFLGLSLLHRYKNSRENNRFDRTFGILDEKLIAKAEMVGKAMRFGAMFAVDEPHKKAALAWRPKRKELFLKIEADAAGLFGEVAEARFQSLAQALGGEGFVKIAT
ncbi:Ppx/GppA family phosphatase [Maritimibacter sp. UBA3975]|uniref:Ppx/GppA family phosphatase n=1 Tax=Maritimibacter sp. UBA3975 TaxID=1946833 RepID=UPI000C0B49C6|nr:Ppx/GppA family phosphatase [Maritimibacter sp. UBA3975]MAM62649.1 exopolyphosphatase [Maritimibacter sp.]|tara:strand:+ start:634 stop:2169 length:1536 start_codon:yes stop_codon:yes gene_type:complete